MAQKPPSQKLEQELMQGLIMGSILATQDASWDSLQLQLHKLAPKMDPDWLQQAYQIYTTDPTINELKTCSKSELYAISQIHHQIISQRSFTQLTKASQQELERLVTLTIDSCSTQCSTTLIHQKLTSLWPELQDPAGLEVLTKFTQIIDSPETRSKIELHNTK